jgi:AcrR family transcriptional regulator
MASARREEILRAALSVCAERGLRGTSIDAVADRAGLTRQGVLHYYPSKKHLLFALLRLREVLNREQLQSDWNDPDMAGRLAEAITFDLGLPALAQVQSVVTAEAAVGQEPSLRFARERRWEMRERITTGLRGRFGERLPSGLTPETAAVALMALFDGLQQQWVDEAAGGAPDAVRDVLATLLFGSRHAAGVPAAAV